MDCKQFKDPIYGYVKIPVDYVNKIIDTNIFQRLRRIIQTSYSPLYPAAIHNRFVHSIGVFHLGQILSDKVLEAMARFPIYMERNDWEHIAEIFKLACILHDVGHAPFSHTGEKFFLDSTNEKNRYSKLHSELLECVKSESLKKDIPALDSKAAAPHEIMSAIIGLNEFEEFFSTDFEREFFARCITGYKFSDDYEQGSIFNCFVSLLNSKVIDVDRLDYLIRDAYFTGFETINIDYFRLLNSLLIVVREITVEEEDVTKYEIAYNKNAVSIIENVVYAHDAERKWIQTHPIVLYDMYIIQHIIHSMDKWFKDKGVNLFSIEALSSQGVAISEDETISLLCDDDIVHFLKKKTDDELCNEFFSRNTRRHPLWKSEAEYKAYLSLEYNGQPLAKLEKAFDETEQYLRKFSESWIINDDVIEKVEEELEKIKNADADAVDAKSRDKQLKTKQTILKLMTFMRKYANSHNCKCDFVILKASQFYSGFNKAEFESLPIVFKGKEDKVHDFKKVVSTLGNTDEKDKEYFYLYYKYDKNGRFDKEDFCKELYKEFI